MEEKEIRRIVKEILKEELKKGIQVGENTTYIKNNEIHVSASTPKIHLEGSEGSAKNLSLRENAGKLECYDEDASAKSDDFDGTCITSGSLVTTQVSGGAITYAWLDDNTKRQRQAIRIAVDAAAADAWERSAYYAPVPVIINDAGIIPDTNFGQSGDAAIIEIRNKGINGAGTRSMVSKTFSSAVSGHVYTSFGAITSGYVASGEAVAIRKTTALSGQIVPASVVVLNVERGG